MASLVLATDVAGGSCLGPGHLDEERCRRGQPELLSSEAETAGDQPIRAKEGAVANSHGGAWRRWDTPRPAKEFPGTLVIFQRNGAICAQTTMVRSKSVDWQILGALWSLVQFLQEVCLKRCIKRNAKRESPLLPTKVLTLKVEHAPTKPTSHYSHICRVTALTGKTTSNETPLPSR